MTIVKIKFTFISLSAVQNMIYFISNQSTIKVSQRELKKRIVKHAGQNILFCPINKEKEKPTNNQYQV